MNAQQIAAELRAQADNLNRAADILDPPQPQPQDRTQRARKPRRKATTQRKTPRARRTAPTQPTAPQTVRINVLSRTAPTAGELRDRTLRYTTSQ